MPAITPKGMAALGPVDRLPRSPARLREHWFAQLETRSRRILEAVIEAHPRQLMTTELAVRAGYPDHKGGSFKNGLGALRTLGLLSKGNPVRVAQELVG
jgi:hypothetical protein